MIRLIYIELAIVLSFAGIHKMAAEPLRIVSYNVENLFHPKHDTIIVDERIIEKDDYEWTPEGERHWNYTRYYRKVENIARVLTNIGEWDGVDIVGLQEVENALCVKRLCYTLRPNEYDFVHYESLDPRGIDVALIYKKARVDTLFTKILTPISSKREEELKTRDILYVQALVDKKDTLHLFVCHLPSQRDGAAESEWKRDAVKKTLQSAIDSIYLVLREPKIVVMGDFNSKPKDNLRGLKNRMKVPSTKGTHKHQGRWTCLDQFYTSPALDSVSSVTIYDAEWIQEPDEKYLGLKPKRTYNGFQYRPDSYSDHLPIVMELKIKNY